MGFITNVFNPKTALFFGSVFATALPPSPSVWVLLGVKGGDNAQALDLAKTVGWRYETRQLRFKPLHALPHVLLGGSLANPANFRPF